MNEMISSSSTVKALPGPCTFPRPAKSVRSLQKWLASEGRAIAPQHGQCLLTLERYPESAIRCTRLVPLDIQHHEVGRTILQLFGHALIVSVSGNMLRMELGSCAVYSRHRLGF